MIGLAVISPLDKKQEPVKTGPCYRPYPDEAKVFEGYGATSKDIQRGYLESGIKDSPMYDKVNYNERWTQPKEEDFVENFEFTDKSRRSKGLFTRPRTPTER